MPNLTFNEEIASVLKFSAEAYTLSRHYEQTSFTIGAAYFAVFLFAVSNVANLKVLPFPRLLIVTGIIILILTMLVVLQKRYAALSIRQFHIAQTLANDIEARLNRMYETRGVFPFDINNPSAKDINVAPSVLLTVDRLSDSRLFEVYQFVQVCLVVLLSGLLTL